MTRQGDGVLNGNGSGGFGLMTLARVVALLGAPTVISLFLIWWVTSTVERNLHEREMEHHEIIQLLREQNARVDIVVQRFSSALYTICMNAATTSYQAAVCNQEQPAMPKYQQPTEVPPKR